MSYFLIRSGPATIDRPRRPCQVVFSPSRFSRLGFPLTLTFTIWFIIVGMLLIGMAISGSLLQRLPLTTSILYLLSGLVIGVYGTGFLTIDAVEEAELLERITELAVIVSLFTAGLKLRIEWRDNRWRLPLRLAVVSMTATVGMIAIAGVFGLGLPLGAAILLGAVLAPTDPVLASEVEVEDARDQDRLRFSLTGEAGLNDGTAFPFVMLGLGVLGLHEMGNFGWRWVAIDLVWAVLGGLAIGAALGTLIGHLVVHLRRERNQATGRDEFLTLGLIALAYGVALYLHAYGFLAVFAAGLALRRVEARLTPGDFEKVIDELAHGKEEERATHADTAPVHMAEAIMGFNEKLGRLGELAVVLLIGSLLSPDYVTWKALWFIPLLLLVIRPLAVRIGLLRSETDPIQKGLISWFGIRGIGSLYYLTYAIVHGLPEDLAAELTAITLMTIAVSIILHGITVTPLMTWYENRAADATGKSENPEPAA